MFKKLFKLLFNYPVPEYICGECGTDKEQNLTGYCINGHDSWVNLDDFVNYPNYINMQTMDKDKLFKLLS